MGARERTEEVLRQIHVIMATAEPYPNSSKKIVLERQKFLDVLKDLSLCVEDMMEEYELSNNSKDRADREMRKKGEELRNDARRDAEDIYAASLIYTDQALREIQSSIDKASRNLTDLYNKTIYELDQQRNVAQNNQLELISKLEDLKDTKKYLRLIQDENIRVQKEKEKEARELKEYREMKEEPKDGPEIIVNTEYLKKMGMSVPGEEEQDEDI